MSPPQSRPVILAAAGTGGHLYPALAVYRALKAQNLTARLFTDKRGMRFADGFEPQDIDIVPSGGLVSGSIPKRLGGLFNLLAGWWRCQRLLRQYQASGVIGFGGYGGVPAILAAKQLGLKSLLYQGDAVLGRANAFVAKYVSALCLSFPNTAAIPRHAQAKTHVVGAPLRTQIEALHEKPYLGPIADEAGDQGAPMKVLCVGGSLGAKVFADILPQAFGCLDAASRTRFQLVQQVTDPVDRAHLAGTYKGLGMDVELLGFVDEMDQRLQACDLLIARAGGTTVHECAAVGRASVWIPLGLHADGQQTHNAKFLQMAGAGWIVPQNDVASSGLADIMRALIDNPQQLTEKAKIAKSVAILGAANRILSLAKTEFDLK